LAQTYDDLLQVIVERGKDPRMAGIPGGTTGLVILEAKSVGGKLLVEASVDVSTIRELRGLSDQIRKELGQHTEKVETKGQLTIESSVRLLSDEDLDRELSIYLSGTRDAAQGALTGAAGDNVPATAGEESADVSAEAGS
jgi:hypothetical protein